MSVQKKATNKPRLIALKDITLDPQLQARTKVDERHIEEMAEVIKSGERLRGELPVVFSAGNANWLADGFHRWHAHALAGEKKMECDVRHGGFEDAQRYAMREANVGHAIKLSEDDVKRKVLWHIEHEKYRHFSDEQIANWCHCKKQNVQLHRASSDKRLSLEVPAEIPDCLLNDSEIKIEHKHKVQWKKITDKQGIPSLYYKGSTLCVYDIAPIQKRAEEKRAEQKKAEAQEGKAQTEKEENRDNPPTPTANTTKNPSPDRQEASSQQSSGSGTSTDPDSPQEGKAQTGSPTTPDGAGASGTTSPGSTDAEFLPPNASATDPNRSSTSPTTDSPKAEGGSTAPPTNQDDSMIASSGTKDGGTSGSTSTTPGSDDKLAKAVAWVVQVWKDYERVYSPAIVADNHKLTIAEAEQAITDAILEFDTDTEIEAFSSAALEMYLVQRPDITNDELGKLLSMDFQEVAKLRIRPEWEGPVPLMVRRRSSPTHGTTSHHLAP
jgi:hypothetical protein